MKLTKFFTLFFAGIILSHSSFSLNGNDPVGLKLSPDRDMHIDFRNILLKGL